MEIKPLQLLFADGIEDRGWFLGFHCITKYVKVAFFRGTSLRPLPPVESKQKDVRYLDIYENDQLDEKLVARLDQASVGSAGRTFVPSRVYDT